MASQKPVQGQVVEGQNANPLAVLDSYNPDQFNIVAPVPAVRTRLGTFFSASVEQTRVDANPENKEVFPVGSRLVTQADGKEKWVPEYCLSGTTLNRLADLAAVSYGTRRTDDRRNPDIVEFQATATMRKGDGTCLVAMRTKAIDLREVETEVTRIQRAKVDKAIQKGKIWLANGRECNREKHRGSGSWITEEEIENEKVARIQAEMSQKRKHKIAICETGAILRAVRALLAIKSTYTKEELLKPFAVFRIEFQPPMGDPDVKRAIIAYGLQAQGQLYGASPVEMGQAALTPGRPLDNAAVEIVDGEGEELAGVVQNGHPVPDAGNDEPSGDDGDGDGHEPAPGAAGDEKVLNAVADLRPLSKMEHAEMIIDLAKRKGAGEPGGLTDLSADQRISIILQLLAMPDAEEKPTPAPSPVSVPAQYPLGRVFRAPKGGQS